MYAGVYLSDIISIEGVNIGRVNFFSATLPSGAKEERAALGFGKESMGKSLPEILFENGNISEPIITFVQFLPDKLFMQFGECFPIYYLKFVKIG